MVSKRAGYIDGQPVSDLRDVDTSSLVFALCNCIKELNAEIEASGSKGGRWIGMSSQFQPLEIRAWGRCQTDQEDA